MSLEEAAMFYGRRQVVRDVRSKGAKQEPSKTEGPQADTTDQEDSVTVLSPDA